jgi:hypothetical protein
MMRRFAAAAMLLAMPVAVHAQAIKPPKAIQHFTAEQIAAVEMPVLAFEETPEMTADYDKYFYFHREGTDFDTAFADISECDALSSGISYYAGGDSYMANYYATQYGLAGVAGGVIGSAVADAIFGSAERRRLRRVNMRNCMGFKGYARYGMERELWQQFHFEEGNGRVEGEKRTGYLMKQARVASGAKPQQEVLPK